jgi:hypothetical protein
MSVQTPIISDIHQRRFFLEIAPVHIKLDQHQKISTSISSKQIFQSITPNIIHQIDRVERASKIHQQHKVSQKLL